MKRLSDENDCSFRAIAACAKVDERRNDVGSLVWLQNSLATIAESPK